MTLRNLNHCQSDMART